MRAYMVGLPVGWPSHRVVMLDGVSGLTALLSTCESLLLSFRRATTRRTSDDNLHLCSSSPAKHQPITLKRANRTFATSPGSHCCSRRVPLFHVRYRRIMFVLLGVLVSIFNKQFVSIHWSCPMLAKAKHLCISSLNSHPAAPIHFPWKGGSSKHHLSGPFEVSLRRGDARGEHREPRNLWF